jgi:tyrosine-protein kinase Etk/Wzc
MSRATLMSSGTRTARGSDPGPPSDKRLAPTAPAAPTSSQMSVSESPRRPAAIPADRARDTPARTSDPLSLLRLLNAVLRGRALIVGTALAVAAAVVTFGLALPRKYSATASFVPQGSSAASNLTGIAAQFGISVQGGEDTQSPQFYVDLVSSRLILRDVVDTTYLFHADAGARRGTLADFFGVPARAPALRREEAIDHLRRHLSTTVAPKTGVITLTVSTSDAELSSQIARRVLTLLNRFNLETRQSQAAAERRFTERRLAEVRGDLRAAENRLQEFLQRNRLYRDAPELQFQQERLSRDVVLQQQLYNSLAQAYEQAKLDEVRDTPVITVIEQPEAPVRPDRRHLIEKGLLGIVAGALLGLIVVVGGYVLRASGETDSDEAEEFAALRRAALDDLKHPWRPVARLLTRRRVASY